MTRQLAASRCEARSYPHEGWGEPSDEHGGDNLKASPSQPKRCRSGTSRLERATLPEQLAEANHRPKSSKLFHHNRFYGEAYRSRPSGHRRRNSLAGNALGHPQGEGSKNLTSLPSSSAPHPRQGQQCYTRSGAQQATTAGTHPVLLRHVRRTANNRNLPSAILRWCAAARWLRTRTPPPNQHNRPGPNRKRMGKRRPASLTRGADKSTHALNVLR